MLGNLPLNTQRLKKSLCIARNTQNPLVFAEDFWVDA
jgi:hypothetical protein